MKAGSAMDVDQLQRLVSTQMPAQTPRGDLGRLLALMHEIDHNGLSHLLAPLRAAAHNAPRP
ncbi:putative quorum-sensing-regulated virulence factor [Paracidovorax sp. MALMAid1276]|uniref:putative quorum-sensing-regulated virulence factor n=1 Tax=Paracidovorax sp. MALMAid1276 TaxID=3411631 RepID=UPI003B9B21A5